MFSEVPTNLHAVLEEVSVLPTFDVDALKVVLKLHNAEHVIVKLSHLDAFAVRVDHRAAVYRLHPIMQAYLEERLIDRCGLEYLNDLCRRAALYSVEGSFPFQAIIYALRIGDDAFVDEIVGRIQISLSSLAVDMDSFNELMKDVNKWCKRDIPQLLPSRALYELRNGNIGLGKKLLGDAKAALAKEAGKPATKNLSALEADIRFVQAYCDLYSGPPDSDEIIDELTDVRIQTLSADPMYQGILSNSLSTLLVRKGRLKEAHNYLNRAIREFDRAGSHFSLIINSFHAGMLHVLEGNLAMALDRIEMARNTVADTLQRHAAHRALVEIYRAECLFECGDINTSAVLAKRAFEVTVDSGDYWPDLLAQTCRLAARSAFAIGGFPAADEILRRGIGLAGDRGYNAVLKALQGLHIHLAVIAEQKGTVEALYEAYERTFDDIGVGENLGNWWREESYLLLGLIRYEIYQQRSSVALKVISKYQPIYEKHGLKWFGEKLEVLKALAIHEAKPHPEADVAASMIVPVINASAKAYGFLSVLLAEGEAARRLLATVTRRYRRIGAGDLDGLKPNLLTMHEYWLRYNQYTIDKKAPLPSLTTKQSAVLEMVAAKLSYKQMSEKAGVTESAIFHIMESLKEKFEVETREELAALVRFLEFLEIP